MRDLCNVKDVEVLYWQWTRLGAFALIFHTFIQSLCWQSSIKIGWCGSQIHILSIIYISRLNMSIRSLSDGSGLLINHVNMRRRKTKNLDPWERFSIILVGKSTWIHGVRMNWNIEYHLSFFKKINQVINASFYF